MNGKDKQPKTLQEAIVYFSNPDAALNYMAGKRWPNGVFCPTCARADVSFLENQKKWQCKSRHEKRQFSVKVGTIFEDSPIPMEKWLPVVWMLVNCKNGMSSYEVAKAIGVTQKTAWFMLHRVRWALSQGSFEKSKLGGNGGPVQMDETYVGGKPQNMHKNRRLAIKYIRESYHGVMPNKTAVFGMLDSETRKVRANVVGRIEREALQEAILNSVAPGSTLHTDQSSAYWWIARDNNFVHEIVNHTKEYVRGQVHTNGIENFWSLLKRTLKGTYVAVEPFHLDRYVDEQVFRFNYRKDGKRVMKDHERFDIALSQVAGKRLTFAEVTGKTGTATPAF